jgi:hypothetical protein
MWPGEQQPGGQQPQWQPPQPPQHPAPPYPQQPGPGPYTPPPSPYAPQPPTPQPPAQQPGYGYPGQQPGYGQPAPQQPPSAYPPQPQPGGYYPPQEPPTLPPLGDPAWGQAPPPGGKGSGGRKGLTVALVAVAVLAVAGAVTIVVADRGGGSSPQSAPSPTPSPSVRHSASPTPSPTPTPSATATGGGDDDRGPAAASSVKPVVPGWHSVFRNETGIAFDVPKGWAVQSQGMYFGYESKDKKVRVAMAGTAVLGAGWCGSDAEHGLVGSKGGKGATSAKTESRNEAVNWAYAKYDDSGKARITVTENKPFSDAHGISGYEAVARVTGVPAAKCSSNGVVYTVTYKGKDSEFHSWVLMLDTGWKGEPSTATIEKIRSSIRPIG